MLRRLLLIAIALALPGIAAAELYALAYHDVRDRVERDFDPDQFAVSTEHLAAHFRWLKGNGYTVVNIDQIIAARNGGTPLPQKAVLLSFDDGLRSVYTHVYPLLKLFGYSAVVSPVTSWIETTDTIDYGHRPMTAEDFLTWEQLRELQASGLVEIASHSHAMHQGIHGNPQGNLQPAASTHAFKGGEYETDAEYAERLRTDLSTSVAALRENIGATPRVITWPYGEHTGIAREVAAEEGMAWSLTLVPSDNLNRQPGIIGRELPQSNPSLQGFFPLVMPEEQSDVVRAAQVDLDYVYDPDPVVQERNLGVLLERIQALEISHVFLQAFADPDGDGGADALYFPNRHLPVRADLFNRAAWQLRTRAGVKVFAWLPLLSFTGDAFDADWRVMQDRNGERAPDPDSEPRLSPFNENAQQRITEIYADLARYAHFAGVHFHDDGRLNEFEDASPAALAAYAEAFGPEFSVAAAQTDKPLLRRWANFKAEALVDFSLNLLDAVRSLRPAIKSSRNLFASAVLDPNAVDYLAQDYSAYLANYDYATLMAMPGLEGAEDRNDFYQALLARVGNQPRSLVKTIFQIQTVDWQRREPLPSKQIAATLRMLQANGVRNFAYYPDDFIQGHPQLGELKKGLSLADYPWRPR